MTGALDRLAYGAMAEENAPRVEVVEFAAAPGTRTWIAATLALGAAVFFSAGALVLGEVFLSLRRPVLEALFLSR